LRHAIKNPIVLRIAESSAENDTFVPLAATCISRAKNILLNAIPAAIAPERFVARREYSFEE